MSDKRPTELELSVTKMDATCIDCKHFTFEPGERGYYPGEGCCPSMACAKQVWALEFEDGQEAFVRCLKTAPNCQHFEPTEEALEWTKE